MHRSRPNVNCQYLGIKGWVYPKPFLSPFPNFVRVQEPSLTIRKTELKPRSMKDKYLLSLAHIIFLLGLGAYTTQVLVSEKSKNKKAEKLLFPFDAVFQMCGGNEVNCLRCTHFWM